MNSINRIIRRWALTAFAAAACLSQAEAAPVAVSVSPLTQDTTVGGTATIDIVVSGLAQPGDAVGGFSMTLGFNSVLLGADTSFNVVGYKNDPGVKMGASPLDLSGGFIGGSLDLFFTADTAETQLSLAGSEGTGFTLAEVHFSGLANGLSPLTLSNVVLSNWDGSAHVSVDQVVNGQICVGGSANCTNVPEPASTLLVAAAVGALVTTRRKQAA